MAFGATIPKGPGNRKALIEALQRGPVLIQYRKVTTNGGIRFALGTLNPSLYRYTFKGGDVARPLGLLRYWDLGTGGWRSCYSYNVEAWSSFDINSLS